ncbi:hypothetical protein DRP05_12470 [Archaeoglobales archaeon]|nr:MAG: hypothetical protein DRP05_12470 [Archaeoglobales archaeon]
MLMSIASDLVKFSVDWAVEVYIEAINLIEMIENLEERSHMLGWLYIDAVHTDNEEVADKLFPIVLQAINRIDNLKLRADALLTVLAKQYAYFLVDGIDIVEDDLIKVIQAIRNTEDPEKFSDFLLHIIDELLEYGIVYTALEMTMMIDDPKTKVMVLRKIGRKMVEEDIGEGMPERLYHDALKLASYIDDPRDQLHAMIDLAIDLAKFGSAQDVEFAFKKSVKLLSEIIMEKINPRNIRIRRKLNRLIKFLNPHSEDEK